MNDKRSDSTVSYLASFLDSHGVTAADAAEMSTRQYGLCVDLARLSETPNQRAVVVSLASRQSRRNQAIQDFRDRLARLERQTR